QELKTARWPYLETKNDSIQFTKFQSESLLFEDILKTLAGKILIFEKNTAECRIEGLYVIRSRNEKVE
ncbi:MAG: hypothetical protein Q8924_20245, partial [Bacillota bacterium]|nr:hypothetical protein [Bacillota bacterium]